MTKGNKCNCNKPDWVIIHYKHNHSAFESPKYAPHYSEYSTVYCNSCGGLWRTKAKYVESLPLSEEYYAIK